ncbi:alpha/beta hydrolase [Pseudovibrio ascidiaceicola]|uniref:alpha/beta hydrolase n=1 Tax=Pseudovibrio ascidiaceicola TaxID=285279 RepID=UPI00135B4E81|nr:alpha/beta hydrolase [Pseudovibrio ascidiaceicola]
MRRSSKIFCAAMVSLYSLTFGAQAADELLTSGVNKVEFDSLGSKLAGNLYLPEEFDPQKQYKTVIYSGPFTQIKEQTGAVYGAKLANKGYVVLTFDHVGFGESEGTIRNYENPFFKMENIRDGVSYLNTLSFVDGNQLFGLGVCASGSYMALVATTDKRIKAISTVSGIMSNSKLFFEWQSKEQAIARLSKANAARQKTYETGEIEYIDDMGLERVNLETTDKNSVFYGAADFYLTERGGAQTYPRYSHKGPAFTRETFTLADALAVAPYLYTPYLGIYGEHAMQDTAPLTIEFYEKANAPKELVEIKDANHVSLYDNDKHVDQAIDQMDTFFSKQAAQQ